MNEEESTPLTFSLSEGSESADIPVPSAYVRGEALTGEDLASLLARLPALIAGPSLIQRFLISRTKSSRRRSRARPLKMLSRLKKTRLP